MKSPAEQALPARCGVIGTGAMGPGIALSLATGGFDVVLLGRSDEALEAANGKLIAAAPLVVEAGIGDDVEPEAITGRIGLSKDLDELHEADYVVEAIPENLAAKTELYTDLEKVVSPEAVVASTTSAQSPSVLQVAMAHPERFIVTHYAQPAELDPVCEVVSGSKTAPATEAVAVSVLAQCGVAAARCADVPGFVWSRLQLCILRECAAIVDAGIATVADVDLVMKQGYASRLPAMGPFEHADLGGLDLMSQLAQEVWPHLDNADSPSGGLLSQLVGAGRMGIKTGTGFYDWSARDSADFRRRRDEEVLRRRKALANEISPEAGG
ncbi:MAG: 3-hydroxyacyl-CoA dehydrogenase family protein [Bryobacterales bacterium]|nr:3-hydroxyacyl-CoA dehydrogenase family protein [Bryobacterales bacterium]